MIEPKIIPLRARNGSVRAYAIVDAADFEWLSRWRWHLDSNGYAVRQLPRENGKQHPMPMHRQLLGLARDDQRQGDHVNRNRLDNRRENLRAVARGSNAQNRLSDQDSSSRHRGVCWNGLRGKWYAYARVDGVLHHLGVFDDEDDAGLAAAAFRAKAMPFSEEAVA